jgi:hypothetical protein
MSQWSLQLNKCRPKQYACLPPFCCWRNLQVSVLVLLCFICYSTGLVLGSVCFRKTGFDLDGKVLHSHRAIQMASAMTTSCAFLCIRRPMKPSTKQSGMCIFILLEEHQTKRTSMIFSSEKATSKHQPWNVCIWCFSVKDLTALLFQLLQNRLDGDPTRQQKCRTSWNQTQLNFSHAS